jgi:hypothetical protein
MKKRARTAPFAGMNRLVVALGLTITLAAPAMAQNINGAVTIEDLGFTLRLSNSARAAALAGTYTATGDDAQALVYNPAGLARLRRIELGAGFQHQRSTLENEFYGSPSQVDVTATTLDHVSWAYPVPTYRGSFVVGASVTRVHTSSIDILNRGFNTTTQTSDDYRLQQNGSVYSYNLGFGIDLAPTLSMGMGGFILDGSIDALTQFTYSYPPPYASGELIEESVIDNAKADVDGIGGVIGFQYNPISVLNFGVSLRTPVYVNLRGSAIQDVARYYNNAADEFDTESFLIDTDYKIPFRIDGGVGLRFGKLLMLAGEVGWSDWTQAEINDFRLRDGNLRPVFRDVVDVRVGAEARIPATSVMLRGGYAYIPYTLEFLQADRIEGSSIQKADTSHERQLLSGGVGVLLGNALQVDAAAEYYLGERTIPTLTDKRETVRFILSTSFHF